CHRERAAARDGRVKLLQRLARPEQLLEAVRLAPGAAEGDYLFDDDRPAPDGGEQKTEHDDLDDRMRGEKQLHEGEAGGCGRLDLLERIHGLGPRVGRHRSRARAGCKTSRARGREAAASGSPPCAYWCAPHSPLGTRSWPCG